MEKIGSVCLALLAPLAALVFSACALQPTPAAPASFPATAGPRPVPTATAPPTPLPGTLYVNPNSDLGPISPLIYGSNYGPWVAVPFQMLPAAFNSGVTNLRFPAGSWGDQNNVQTFAIDTFMGILQKMRATALINVRLENGSPAQAAALVHYVNIDRSYHVRYWAVGNEPNLYSAASTSPYDTAQFNREWRAFALAMRAVDPSILLVGPEISQFTDQPAQNPKDSLGLDWMTEFLKANGDLVDVVSFHRYPFPHGNFAPPADITELHQNVYEWDGILASLRDQIRLATGRDLPIAVTEFNSHYSTVTRGEATPDSHYNAIWTADILGRMLRGHVLMADQWLLTSQDSQGGWGLIGNRGLRPSYYVYQMYKLFGSEQVYSSSDDPDLSIYAARRPDGTVTVVVINLGLAAKTEPLRIEGQPRARAEVWCFDPTHNAADMGRVDLPGPLTLPPQSMMEYIYNPRSKP